MGKTRKALLYIIWRAVIDAASTGLLQKDEQLPQVSQSIEIGAKLNYGNTPRTGVDYKYNLSSSQ